MRLHFDSARSQTRVTSYGAGFVEVNAERYTESLVIFPDRIESPWGPASIESLSADLLTDLLESLGQAPLEILLLGTGPRQVFPPQEVMKAALDKGIGMEVMDTTAACRTFNVLAAEDRAVAAILLLGLRTPE